jgi:putative toxin-antitoxin system antitoxin component (TIGR02293 family)
MTAAAVTAMMGGRRVFKRLRDDRIDLTEMTRAGLPVEAFLELSQRLGVERKQLGAVLGISERTLSRRLATGERLSSAESDRMMRLARVVAHALDTLGTEQKAASWLKTPNIVLGGESPLSLLDTDAGANEVDTVLGRIDYGIYS